MFERQKTFVYVKYNSTSAGVIHDLTDLLKTQNPQKSLVFKMVIHLKYNKDNIIVIFNN